MREKERYKPLIIDELSYVIYPAIEALKENFKTLEDTENSGCAFDWIYVDGTRLYVGSRGPKSVKSSHSLSLSRLAEENTTLLGLLRKHESEAAELAEMADTFHEELQPEIERLLAEEQLADSETSNEVVTSAIIKEVDQFGEDHELRDFWKKHRDQLIKYANEVPEITLEDMKRAEHSYKQTVENALSNLEERKVNLQAEYRISEDEITPDTDERWGI